MNTYIQKEKKMKFKHILNEQVQPTSKYELGTIIKKNNQRKRSELRPKLYRCFKDR